MFTRIPHLSKVTSHVFTSVRPRPVLQLLRLRPRPQQCVLQRFFASSGKDKCPPERPKDCEKTTTEPPCGQSPPKEPPKTDCSPDAGTGTGGGGTDKAAGTVPYKKPKINLRECKPVDIHPCTPPPPETRSRIPPLNECRNPNLMDECPQPVCPWNEHEKRKKRYRNILIAGILLTIVSLIAAYKVGLYNKPEEKKGDAVKKKKRERRVVIKNPQNANEIPNKVPYLLIGGGTASFSAFRAIKSADPLAKILVVTNESFYPYMRPPLSKEMWYNEDKTAAKNLIFKQWNGSERSLFYEPDDFYTDCRSLLKNKNGGVAVARGWSIVKIDPCDKKVFLENDQEIEYEKCLIATGASPRNLPIFEAVSEPDIKERIWLFKDIYDFQDFHEAFDQAKSVAVIGGGFLGSELSCALARKGKKSKKQISQVFKEPGNLGKVLPEYLSRWTTDKVAAEGVNVVPNAEVVGIKKQDDKLILSLTNGQTLKVDEIVVAVGSEPNTQLAEHADLEIDPLGGYLVNTELMARSNLYIAGDCACFYDPKFGRRRIEHHDHAVVSGRLAGENMAGACHTYAHQSMLWSDLGPDVGFEAIGIVDSKLPTVGVFAKATDKDNPKAVVTAHDEGIRSMTEEVAGIECAKQVDGKEKGDVKKGECDPREMYKPQPGEDFGKGIIFYLRDDCVVGVVLWNVFNRMSIARQVLKGDNKYDDLNEVAKLFNIHEE